MLIGLTTIAYNQPDALLAMAESAVSTTQHDIQFHLFLHSRMNAVRLVCEMIEQRYNCFYHPIGMNVGVAMSWNQGLLESIESECDINMLVNDDILFHEGDIDNMITLALQHPDAWGVFCSGINIGLNKRTNDHGMSCVIITETAIKTIGMFDQNFFPAYNEDLDYAYRARLAGLKKVTAVTNVEHIGSATIKASPALRRQNDATHERNDEYWERKWGAKKPKTKFKRPFNRANFHPYYIDPGMRHAPYPDFNRNDQDIVNL